MSMWPRQVWRAQNNISDPRWKLIARSYWPCGYSTNVRDNGTHSVSSTARTKRDPSNGSSGDAIVIALLGDVACLVSHGQRWTGRAPAGGELEKGEGVISYLHPQLRNRGRVIAIHRLSRHWPSALTLATGYTRVVAMSTRMGEGRIRQTERRESRQKPRGVRSSPSLPHRPRSVS